MESEVIFVVGKIRIRMMVKRIQWAKMMQETLCSAILE